MPGVSLLPDVDLDHLRRRNRDATQRLLGETIAISDEDWQSPSLLPGWTRAHVAAHISRGADSLRHLVSGAVRGRRGAYPEPRWLDVERGSERSALDLQIDLDTSAGQLNGALDALEDEAAAIHVTLRQGLRVPLSVLPLARLAEVEIHRIDLNYEYRVTSIDPTVAGWLLRWYAARAAADSAFPRYRLAAPELTTDVGDGSGPRVAGSVHALLGWLTGRDPHAEVEGASPRDALL